MYGWLRTEAIYPCWKPDERQRARESSWIVHVAIRAVWKRVLRRQSVCLLYHLHSRRWRSTHSGAKIWFRFCKRYKTLNAVADGEQLIATGFLLRLIGNVFKQEVQSRSVVAGRSLVLQRNMGHANSHSKVCSRGCSCLRAFECVRNHQFALFFVVEDLRKSAFISATASRSWLGSASANVALAKP